MSPPADSAAPLPELSRHHLRRLRQYFRSAGWPCRDNVELDLLERGLVRRAPGPDGGLESIVVTDEGIAALARYLEGNRQALAEHEALVAAVARHLLGQKRLVFRRLSFRVRTEERWTFSRPDVFSLRQASSSRRLAPLVHEVKVRRADLLGDLKNAAKRRGYQSYSQAFYYVIAEGIAEPDEIPEDCGVMVATARGLSIARPSPHREVMLTTGQWVALARSRPDQFDEDDPQLAL